MPSWLPTILATMYSSVFRIPHAAADDGLVQPPRNWLIEKSLNTTTPPSEVTGCLEMERLNVWTENIFFVAEAGARGELTSSHSSRLKG